MANLTLADLDRVLEDEEHLGHGYAIRDDCSYGKRVRLDRAVVAVANELGLDEEALFHWTNSKYGRWLVDGVAGCGDSPTKATVRVYLNAEAVAVAMDGVAVRRSYEGV